MVCTNTFTPTADECNKRIENLLNLIVEQSRSYWIFVQCICHFRSPLEKLGALIKEAVEELKFQIVLDRKPFVNAKHFMASNIVSLSGGCRAGDVRVRVGPVRGVTRRLRILWLAKRAKL